jgi:GntR family transcriptional regulator of arabinose operon
MSTIVKQKPLRKDLVRQKIVQMISTLKLKPGDRLGSEKSQAEQFGVNHLTLRSAYAELARLGILDRRPGSGTYVKALPGMEAKHRPLQVEGAKAVVIAMREDPHFFSELRNDLATVLQSQGFLPVMLVIDKDVTPGDVKQLVDLQKMGVENLIVDQAEAVNRITYKKYLDSPDCGFRHIVRVLGNLYPDGDLPNSMVSGDYAGAYLKAVGHLKEYGHRKIAFFSGTTTEDNNAWRANKKFVSLYAQAMIDHGLADQIKVTTASFDTGAMDDSIRALLESPDRPSAIFCDIDYRAVKVVDMARSMGIRVPEDLSVIGFFDTPWAKHYGITSFKFRNRQIAEAVVQALENPDKKPELLLFEIDLVERQSVAQANG